MAAAPFRFCLVGAEESPLARSNRERCSVHLATGGGPSSANRREEGGRWDRPDTDGPLGLRAGCPTQAVNWPPDANPVGMCGNLSSGIDSTPEGTA